MTGDEESAPHAAATRTTVRTAGDQSVLRMIKLPRRDNVRLLRVMPSLLEPAPQRADDSIDADRVHTTPRWLGKLMRGTAVEVNTKLNVSGNESPGVSR